MDNIGIVREGWRPKDWKNKYGSNLDRIRLLWSRWEEVSSEEIERDACWCAYETGADAMFESLLKLAKESPTGKFEIDSRVTNIYEKD